MPGNFTSMAYCAVPLTFAGVSRRGTDLPIRRKSLRSSIRRIDHDARLGLKRCRVDAPFLRGVGDQHLPYLGAGRAELGEIELHRPAADDPHQLLGTERI